GYFYGRGVCDMKWLAADLIDTMMGLKQGGFKAPRTLKMALTCGEVTSCGFNGANWLGIHERGVIDGEFVVNEGGGGRLDNDGKPLIMTVQAAEKFPQDYTLEVTNPGGHSARPVPKNAINQLAAGLVKIAAYQFPIQATDITRGYFAKMAPKAGREMGAAMDAFAKDPTDAQASALLASAPNYNGALHTTRIAIILPGGQAANALLQRATARVSCRIFPGTTPDQVRQKLAELAGDPEIKVTLGAIRSEVPK